MHYQEELYQYFSSSVDADQLWNRLHKLLSEYGIGSVLYGVSDMPLTFKTNDTHFPIYCKTSYPEHLLTDTDSKYSLENDAGAIHCLNHTSPFIWDINSRWVSAKEREQRITTDVFWYTEPVRIGVTIPLRFGLSGVGGMGFWASELSSDLFDQYWEVYQEKLSAIAYIFDKVARTHFSDLLGIHLSPREKEIIGALAEGDSAKLIANRLGTSANTVSNQIVSARKKLGAVNNVHLVVKAMTLDLLPS